MSKTTFNLAKLYCDFDKSPTVMAGEAKKLVTNRGILKPNWAYIYSNQNFQFFHPIMSLSSHHLMDSENQ
jgi:hypothetical protein